MFLLFFKIKLISHVGDCKCIISHATHSENRKMEIFIVTSGFYCDIKNTVCIFMAEYFNCLVIVAVLLVERTKTFIVEFGRHVNIQ